MSEHPSRPSTTDDEIDLSVVFKAIQNFFKRILIGIVNIVQFYWRHKFILIGLIIAGAVLGYFWDKSFDKTYKNQLLVIPNFESANYLYNKIESIESKLSAGDTVFLKEVFGDEYKSVSSIEVLPVVDIYNFVSISQSNQDLFELLFEEEANMEFLSDPINSRNYEFHTIHLSVTGEEYHEVLSNALIVYLNDNPYFKEMKQMSQVILKKRLEDTKNSIDQIDSILKYSNQQDFLKIDDTKFSINDNTGLKDLILAKRDLGKNLELLSEDVISQTEIIKQVDANFKYIDKQSIFKKSKIKLFPLIFFVLFSLISLFRHIYKKTRDLTS